jgi:PAS domain-containing protein
MRSRILNIISILLVLTALNSAHAQQARKPSKRALIGTVHFRPPTIWQQYRGYVIGAAGLVASQTAMIAGLLLQRRRRRRVEQDLAFSEQRLQLIANSLPALIAHVDRDQRYNFANQAYKEWFGLEPQQLLGRTIREVVGDRLYCSVRPHVERALAGERVSFTTDMIREGERSRSLDAI